MKAHAALSGQPERAGAVLDGALEGALNEGLGSHPGLPLQADEGLPAGNQRSGLDRRLKDVGSPTGVERRTGERRSVLADNQQINMAIRLIRLGARLQMLEAETKLPYERLLKLYKEVAGKSPPKGQLPFSTDWFMAWQPNIHASLFYNYYEYLQKASDIESLEAIIKAYQMYERELELAGVAPAMSITRAWRLVKFVDCGMLSTTKCTRCKGQFVNHSFELSKHYVCGLCAPPARAGKAKGKDAIH